MKDNCCHAALVFEQNEPLESGSVEIVQLEPFPPEKRFGKEQLGDSCADSGMGAFTDKGDDLDASVRPVAGWSCRTIQRRQSRETRIGSNDTINSSDNDRGVFIFPASTVNENDDTEISTNSVSDKRGTERCNKKRVVRLDFTGDLLDAKSPSKETSHLSVETTKTKDVIEQKKRYHSQTPSPESYTFCQRQAARVAHHPCTCFLVALSVSLLVSVLGMVLGDFQVAADNAGWTSRGTEIANRQAQFILVHSNQYDLWSDRTGKVWEDLVNNVQPGWETDLNYSGYRRKLFEASSIDSDVQIASLEENFLHHQQRHLPFTLTFAMQRKLQSSTALENCDTSWYSEKMLLWRHLWPIWKPKVTDDPNVLLRQDVLRDLCLSEERTQQVLVEKGLCFGCTDGCLPPYSIVLFARLSLQNGFNLDCSQLAEAWADYNEQDPQFEKELHLCASFVTGLSSADDLFETSFVCPAMFVPVLFDSHYDKTGVVQYTSSIFATKYPMDNIQAMYDAVGEFDRGTDLIEGAYETQYDDFGAIYLDHALGRDMILAMGSAIITMLAILVHTRSPFLSLIGLSQILLSFPLAYSVYTFVFGLEFFPFLNFLGVFVVFALGADDVFVAVDKWKNARIEFDSSAPVETIAATAFPDAAGAMFLTTFTTAVAFFGTAICPVAPIRMFAIFCGLLIVFDYIMCILLIFPALCIYDGWRHRRNFCCSCHCCHQLEDEENEVVAKDTANGESKQSLIRRILTRFYNTIHSLRYPVLVACVVALIVSIVFALKMELPTSSEVRVLPSDNQFEKNFEWRNELQYEVLRKRSSATGFVLWGVTPADTGDHNNPKSFSQLVLDNNFEPSHPEAQAYLLNFCDRFFDNEWATQFSGIECSMKKFDRWLQTQANGESSDDIYKQHCGGATGLPMKENLFDVCIYNWSQLYHERYILTWNQKVKIIYFPYSGRVRYDSPFDDLENEWHSIESWIDNERKTTAPDTADGMFFSSPDYWWYDTNGSMLETAYFAAAIAVATGAMVIIFSSRSLALTLFSAFTIGYVLASVTACLYALNWTLGFLESICFAILIGICSDFIIHFSHAYATPPGKVCRHERTKYALIRMGPSILAAAFTTIASATIMLFTVITFFVKFALILFFTILQATAGSFIVFLVLADCFGPSDPTRAVDWITSKINALATKLWRKKEKDEMSLASKKGVSEEETTEDQLSLKEADMDELNRKSTDGETLASVLIFETN